MGRRRRTGVVIATCFAVSALLGEASSEEGATMNHARGTFEVEMKSLVAEGAASPLQLGRMSIHKTFAGALEGTSVGEMLAVQTATEGSAGYVAVERVDGTLDGRRGSFTLLHQGTMRRGGAFRLEIVVVPDSGTDELAGLAGSMEIVIEGGAHSYDFAYTLPERP